MATKTHIIKLEEAIKEQPVQFRAADPGSPVTDQYWFNTTSKELKYFAPSI